MIRVKRFLQRIVHEGWTKGEISMADDQEGPAAWAVHKADELVTKFANQDQKIPDLALFRGTLAQALEDAYEQGLEAGAP